MKKILGLDLGTTSIGWAFINEAEKADESSKILKAGVRLVPLSNEEISEFGAGQKISLNAGRTLARSARRSLQRFKLRRQALIEIFVRNQWITSDFKYSEEGDNSTYSSLALRAKACEEKISLEELLVVLLMINKKRGYKSSPKDKFIAENGMAIDGMHLAKELMEKNITPGQWVHSYFTSNGFAKVPQFYPSDLKNEVGKIISKQKEFHSEVITDSVVEKVLSLQGNAIPAFFKKELGIELAENKGVRSERIKHLYELRSRSITERIELDELALIVKEIKVQISGGSGYLSAISDRSKTLMLSNQTVGQFLYERIRENPLSPIKGLIFSRQDYMDEFDVIWNTQAKYHTVLNDQIRNEVRDITIFYQRKLRSQKHLIAKCEFEGNRSVLPKSSPYYQLFRIWQNINAIRFTNIKTNETFELTEDQKQYLFSFLNQRDKLKQGDLLKIFGLGKEYSVNFKEIQGNRTRAAFLDAFLKISEEEGHTLERDLKDPELFENGVRELLINAGLQEDLFDFPFTTQDASSGEKSAFYLMWHVIYSAEEDAFAKKWLTEQIQMPENWVSDFLAIPLEVDFGGLSTKAIKKILPHLMDGLIYSEACAIAGYNHSSSLNSEENQKRILLDKLSEIRKNSLRNPVVEKILNQMVNVVNAIIQYPELGRPDEIRIELARELKSNAEQRKNTIDSIAENTKKVENIKKRIREEYGEAYTTKKNILRYMLWEECGGISLYTGATIPASKLFDADYDIDHIIPQSRLFDDSRSNKVLCERALNIDKSNKTAFTYLLDKFGTDSEQFKQFQARVTDLFKSQRIGYTKYQKLLMPDDKIPEDFVERQLKETQYITKKARELLMLISRDVNTTTGIITDRLKEDWELNDLLKQINLERYQSHPDWILHVTDKQGKAVTKIKNWSKRDDHRHHALDAIVIAFTKRAYVQYLNTLNARQDKDSQTYALENKHLSRQSDGKLRFNSPIDGMRSACKNILESILVSHKSKTKVITKQTNYIHTKNGVLKVTKQQETPRGQLHLETVYAQKKRYKVEEVKVSGALTFDILSSIANKQIREALTDRLAHNDNDPKKAFTGKNAISKNPVVYNHQTGSKVSEKVKTVTLENVYTIRKKVAPGLNIDKVIDAKVKRILVERLREFNNDDKKAFSNLEENPIWFNKEKGIAIKSVKVSGISNAVALHDKRDKYGKLLKDSAGNSIPNSWVNTGNNHHVAIYRDENGNLNEEVVSLFEAVTRKKQGMDLYLRTHPTYGKLVLTIKSNEMFLFPGDNFNPFEIDLSNPANYPLISKNLFRVQKIASLNYFFRHHVETKVSTEKDIKDLTIKNLRNVSATSLIKKVRINNLGVIEEVKFGTFN
jgi:CRISPR-associated endonuclease Csn1